MLFYTMEMNVGQWSNSIKHPKSRPYDFRGLERSIDYSWGAFLSFLELVTFYLLYGKELSSMNISISLWSMKETQTCLDLHEHVYMLSKCFWCWVPVLFLVTSLQTSLWTVGSCWGNAYGTSRWPRSPSAPSSSTISSDTWRCPPSTLPRMHLPLLKLVLLSIYKLWVFVLSGWHLWFSSSDALYYYYIWWIPFVWFSSRICWRDTNCSALSFWRSTMTEWVTALLSLFSFPSWCDPICQSYCSGFFSELFDCI